MEVFSRILAKKTAESSEFQFHWRCRKTKLTHLCFADDLLLFCKGNLGSVSVLQEALNVFTSFSGLKPNPSKSEIFFSGVDMETQTGISELLQFQVGVLPVRYLGVPLISTKLRASDCRVLVDRVIRRIKCWTTKFLSFAGRLQLIQSVLFSIQSYWCSHFVLPAAVVNSIEGVLRAFLWKGCSLDTHGAKVAWDDVTRLKQEGGLGIKKVKDWNAACMTRYIWNLCSPCSQSLWVTWVRLNLLNKNHFWVAKVPWNCSWTWRKVLKLRDRVRPFLSMKIGNGLHTSLWFDAWLPRGQICSSPRDRVIYDSGLTKEALVKHVISGNRWCWPVASSNELIDLKRETEVLPPPNASNNDLLLWDKVSRDFSTKAVWHSLRTSFPIVSWFKVVWFKFHIPSHAFILWLAVRKKLATQDRLLSFGLISRMSCLFCREPCEDHDHLFFRCPFTSRVWHTLLAKLGLQDSSQSWEDVLMWISSSCKGSTLVSIIGKLTFAASVYVIWRERNKRKHEHQCVDEVGIIRSIKLLVRLRLMSCSGFPKTNQNRHLIQQWHLPDSILS